MCKRFVTAVLLLALFSGSFLPPVSAATPGLDPLEHFFHPSFGDLQEELAIANAEAKQGILVMFDDKDCPWCHKMKTNILNQPQVQEYFRARFRIARVDTRGDTPLIDFAGREMTEKDFAFKVNRVRATPVFIFYDLKGEKIFRFTGVTRDMTEFLWLGEFIVDGHYKKQKFTAFKRAKRAGQDQPS